MRRTAGEALPNCASRMSSFLARHGFLVAIVAVFVAGVLFPDELARLVDQLPQDVLVATVMFAMSLSLESEALGRAVRRPGAAALACAINLGILPPLGWLVARLLPPDLAHGIIVASSVPCTIASAAVWTRRAGGNEAIAIIVTVITNLACFVVTPAWLELLVGETGDSGSGFAPLAQRLMLTVALPVAAGQLLRLSPKIAHAAHQRRAMLGYYSQFGILAMLSVGAVRCGEQIAGLESAGAAVVGPVVLALVLAAAMHFAAWLGGRHAAAAFGMPPADQTAVAFAGSQKTLMVGLAIAVKFGGLAVVPMVAYHIEQLIMDTLLADWLRRRGGVNRMRPMATPRSSEGPGQ